MYIYKLTRNFTNLFVNSQFYNVRNSETCKYRNKLWLYKSCDPELKKICLYFKILSHFNDSYDIWWNHVRSWSSDIFLETQITTWTSERYHFSWNLYKESLVQLFPRIVVNRIVDPIPNEFWSLVGISMKMGLSHFNDCRVKS